MKPARELAMDFCNKNIINVRGNEVEEFIKYVQLDARQELKEVIENYQAMEYPTLKGINDELVKALQAVKRGYMGSDSDNMEFTFRVPYNVNDQINTALSKAGKL